MGGASVNSNDPCKQLKKMVTKKIEGQSPPKSVLDNLIDLRDNVLQPKERMYYMFPVTSTEQDFFENYAESAIGQDGTEIDFGTNCISIVMHTHYDVENQYSIFSFEDIFNIYYAAQGGSYVCQPSTFTAILITAHGTKYALKLLDSGLNGIPFCIGCEFGNVKKNMFEKYINEYVKLGNTPEIIANNELGFLNFVQEKKLDFEIYKSDNDFSGWTKLELTTNKKGVTTKPCK
jgi:hypothetical protein